MAPSRLIRFFSRRHTKPTSTISKEKSPIKNGLICTIHLLDGEEIHFEIEVNFIEHVRANKLLQMSNNQSIS